MFRGYRNIIATVAGLAIVASAIFLLIRDLSTVDSAYRHSAANASIKYQADANSNIKERCLSATAFAEEDCTAKAYEAAREGQRKEQELAAQNITAWWTKIMGIAALIGMALSAVGVWLVKTTFDETRKANDIARTTAYRQLRPYVYFDKADFQTIKPTPISLNGGIVQILVKNYGQTPAYDVTIAISKWLFDYPLDSKIGLEAQALETDSQVVPPGHSHIITAGFKSEDVVACIKGEKCLTISVSVYYKFRDVNETIAQERIDQTFIFTKEEIDMRVGRPVLPTDYQTSGK